MSIVDTPTLEEIKRELASLRAMIAGATITKRDEWATVDEYAAEVGRSTRTVYAWIDKGIVETKRRGRRIFVRR
jgi:predicted transcriptional regulator